MKSIVSLLGHNKIIPVVDMPSVDDVLRTMESLLEKNITTIELTLRTKEVALAAMKKIQLVFGDKIILGVGTIKNIDDFNLALDHGAQYIVSPGLTSNLLQHSLLFPNIPYIPGVSTASEIMMALECNIRHLKLFPGQAINALELLKSFYGPFRESKFCVTGGVTFNNMNDYLDHPNVFAVGMSKFI